MKRHLLIALCMVIYHASSAQEMWGIANSNYAGAAGMNLNPVSMMYSPYKWEVLLINGDISVQNNYVEYQRNKLNVTTTEGTPDPHGGIVEWNTSGDKNANTHIMMQFPSITFKVGNSMSFGFHTSVRNDLSIRNVPSLLAKFAYEGGDYDPLKDVSIPLGGIRAGEMTWAEAGISAALSLSKNPEKKWLAGVTFKYLSGIEGASLKTTEGNITIGDSVMWLGNLSAEAHTSMPQHPEQVFSFPNRGIGFDFGLSYVSNPHREHFEDGKPIPMKRYDYRVGVSLIDAGFVNFNQNTKSYLIDHESVGFNGKSMQIDSVFTVHESTSSFPMALPTALSFQYDRCLSPKVFLNLSAIQRIPMPMPQVQRPNQVSATLRYETKQFEVDVPYSFYDYYLHRIGFAFRYRVLFIGTDKLGTFIHNNDISGVDFYFGLRFTNPGQHAKKSPAKKVCPAYM